MVGFQGIGENQFLLTPHYATWLTGMVKEALQALAALN
jgi:hypothetical protein